MLNYTTGNTEAYKGFFKVTDSHYILKPVISNKFKNSNIQYVSHFDS